MSCARHRESNESNYVPESVSNHFSRAHLIVNNKAQRNGIARQKPSKRPASSGAAASKAKRGIKPHVKTLIRNSPWYVCWRAGRRGRNNKPPK